MTRERQSSDEERAGAGGGWASSWARRGAALGAAAVIALTGAVSLGAPVWAQSGRDDSLIGGDGTPVMRCRDSETKVRRVQVAGGQDSNLNEFPFIVQVRVGEGKCGGSLIATRTVLTAAHCVIDDPLYTNCAVESAGRCEPVDPSVIRVYRPGPSGRIDISSETRAVALVAHPSFHYPNPSIDKAALNADVALIRLERDIVSSSDGLVSIADPAFDRSYAKGGECAQVAGWGSTDVYNSRFQLLDSGKVTTKLQSLFMELQSQDRCKNTYKGQITDNMICAGDGIEGFNTCSGDSGGPLVVDVGVPVQVGIVSWAYGCAQSEHFTIFTRVGAPEVRDWINARMRVR